MAQLVGTHNFHVVVGEGYCHTLHDTLCHDSFGYVCGTMATYFRLVHTGVVGHRQMVHITFDIDCL